jgi:zinc D-Ala-D-Ala carboxypeptidase
MILTSNFQTHEFLVSKDYPELAKAMMFTYNDTLILKLICESILQPVRDKFGRVEIISGKRSLKLNKAVKGHKDSMHLNCCAVDFTVKDISQLPDIFKFIIHHCDYRTVIYYREKNFIHIDINIPGVSYRKYTEIKGG